LVTLIRPATSWPFGLVRLTEPLQRTAADMLVLDIGAPVLDVARR
jgi:hypothetical protein